MRFLAILYSFVFVSVTFAETVITALDIGQEYLADAPAIRHIQESAGSELFGSQFTLSEEPCGSKSCAQTLLNTGATTVYYGSYLKLGNKSLLVVQKLSADGSFAKVEETPDNTEQLLKLLPRMYKALKEGKDLSSTATTQTVTAAESRETERRNVGLRYGFGFGMMKPIGDSYSRIDCDFSWTGTGDCHTEQERLAFELRAPIIYSFTDAIAMNLDFLLAYNSEIAGDINFLYMFNDGDFTPFAGGGIGIHFPFPDDSDAGTDKRNLAPGANVQGGLMLFRTYNISVYTRAQYRIVASSDVDQGLSGEIGLTYQDKSSSHRGGGGWTKAGIALLGYVLLFGLAGSGS